MSSAENKCRQFIVEVEPRYLIFNEWQIKKLGELPKRIQEAYKGQGINGWMERNLDNALKYERGLEYKITVPPNNRHRMTISVTLMQHTFKDNPPDDRLQKSYNSKDLQKVMLVHLLEQKIDSGFDAEMWAYGVSLDAVLMDNGEEEAIMVFHINSIRETD